MFEHLVVDLDLVARPLVFRELTDQLDKDGDVRSSRRAYHLANLLDLAHCSRPGVETIALPLEATGRRQIVGGSLTEADLHATLVPPESPAAERFGDIGCSAIPGSSVEVDREVR